MADQTQTLQNATNDMPDDSQPPPVQQFWMAFPGGGAGLLMYFFGYALGFAAAMFVHG